MNFDFSGLVFPAENISKTQFDATQLQEFFPLETIRQQVLKTEELIPLYVAHSDPSPCPDRTQGSHLVAWSRKWQQRVAERMSSWHYRFTMATIFDAYRRMAPQAEFQTNDHLRMMGAVATAAGLLTSATVVIDDILDGGLTRNGVPAYHLARPKSCANDIILANCIALRMLKVFVPDHHPCKGEIITTAEVYINNSALYHSYHSRIAEGLESAAKSLPGSPGNPECIPVQHYSIQEYRAMNSFRVFQYTQFMMDMARYAACYQSVPQDSFHAAIDELTLVLCLIEDTVDTAPWELLKDITIGEISAPLAILGEIVNRGYPTEVLGETFRDKIPVAERGEIAEAMARFLGTGSEGDAQRIYEFYERFDLLSMVQKWLRHQLTVVVPNVCGREEEKICCGFLRQTLLETCLVWMVENNPDATAADRQFLAEVRAKSENKPEMIPKILLDALTEHYTKK